MQTVMLAQKGQVADKEAVLSRDKYVGAAFSEKVGRRNGGELFSVSIENFAAVKNNAARLSLP